MNRSQLSRSKMLQHLALSALVVVSAAVAAQTAPAVPASGAMHMGVVQHGNAGPHDMKATMMMGMERMQRMQASGDVDKDFAMLMKLHQHQAVAMAEMQIALGRSPAMKTMARQIIAAQKKEIAAFDAWLAKQK
jgi:uncharacterized protein (DUF305 family)